MLFIAPEITPILDILSIAIGTIATIVQVEDQINKVEGANGNINKLIS